MESLETNLWKSSALCSSSWALPTTCGVNVDRSYIGGTWKQGCSDSVIDTSILFLGQRYTVYIGLVAIKYSCPPDATLS